MFSESEHILILLLSIPEVEVNEGKVPPCSRLPLYSQHRDLRLTELLSVGEFALLTKNPVAD